MSFLDKAKAAAKDLAENQAAKDAFENAAEKAVDVVDDKSGGKVPDAVKNAVDKIDGKDG
jgi:hypothetical protein